jgi:hypothetical protein
MGTIRYRLFLDGKPASQEQLDEVEDISVTQAVDKTWEARLTFAICTDDKGVWSEPSATYTAAFGRVRVEIDPGNGTFSPLIDGPVTGSDQNMSSEPGQSTRVILVQDDSVYLNRNEQIFLKFKKLDHEIAKDLLTDVDHIKSTDIETDTKPTVDSILPVMIESGTALAVLRKLAKRQGKHVYVLPGKKPDTSVAYFRKYPGKPDGLPTLTLLGPDRNLESFKVQEDSQLPATFFAQSLSITDKKVVRAQASFRDAKVLGSKAAGAAIKESSKRFLHPDQDGSVDPKAAVDAAAERASFAIQASGTLLGNCYQAVLSPYRVVTVQGVNKQLSGDYLIASVTHALTRSTYTQSFSLLRNALSEGSKSSALPKVF